MTHIWVFCTFLFLLTSPNITFAQARLDAPTARLQIGNAVPLPIIEKIAFTKASETWGPGAVGSPVPLSDFNGDVVVYMVAYKIGGTQFPTYDTILQGLKEGRELRTLLKNSELGKAGEQYMSMARGGVESPRAVVVAESDEPRRPPIDPVRPDGSLSRTVALEKTREMERFAANKSIGAGEFGTIFLSASYDRFPVLAYFHYLAPYLIHFDLALVRAEQAIGAGAVLDHYYFSGLDGQFFEFKSPSGSVLLNSKTFEATSLEKLKDSKISPVHPPTGAAMLQHNREMTRTEISKEWEKLSSEIGSK